MNDVTRTFNKIANFERFNSTEHFTKPTMKILKRQVLRGPNRWSNYRQLLIQIRLDLEEMEEFPTDMIEGFNERLQKLLPGMIDHECSEGVHGGFFIRVERGTWLGHVMEHIALELQSLAGMETGYGRTRETETDGIYNVVFSYTIEQAGLYAADAAFRIIDALRLGNDYDLEADIEELRNIKSRFQLGPSTQSIVDEAKKRGIPWRRMGTNSAIQLGYGANQRQFQATITANTSAIGVDRAANKNATKQLLSKAKIPVAIGDLVTNEIELKETITKIGYPVVVKPFNGNHGNNITTNITTWEQALDALKTAQIRSKYVLVEKYVSGFDFRALVIDGKFIAAAKRIPAHIIGDGKSTIKTLLEIENTNPLRGEGHEKVLTKITFDKDSETLISKLGYTLESIPPKEEVVFLKSTANLSTGATAIDVTDEVHSENKFMLERIAKIIGLDVCGIDIIASDLKSLLRVNGGVILEANAAPGFRMHISPSQGKSRNVAAAVVDSLFPKGSKCRIPLISVTGTNGKTTTTRLIAHMSQTSGNVTGYTTTDGIYINDFLIQEGDTTGPMSAELILSDPTVEFAVLETARGGLLRSGLAFDKCDIGIITNIKEDHLGLNDINTLEDLANVKAVVARSVKQNGWAILNADDAHCVKIARALRCNVAFFSMNIENEVIQRQMKFGNPVAVFEDGFLTIITGTEKIRVEQVNAIPITMEGKCGFMIANALTATLAGYLHGFSILQLQHALQTFKPGFEQTPGRLNKFEFSDFDILVDYAHNPHGYKAIEQYISQIDATRKVGLISGVGDRRDEDIRECAEIAARMFDHIIIKQEHSLRDRTEAQINKLLLEGFENAEKKITYEIFYEEVDAVKHALDTAQKGDFIVALCDKFRPIIALIEETLKNEKQQPKIISLQKSLKNGGGGMHYSQHGKQIE